MNQMSRCPESEDLAAWLEGSLGPTERAAVRRHLADCDDCRRAVGLAGTLGPVPAGGARSEGTARMAEWAARQARRGRFRRAGGLAAAAALAVGLAVGRRTETVPRSVPEPAAPPSVAVEAAPVPPAPPPPRVVVRPSPVPSLVETPPPPVRPDPSPASNPREGPPTPPAKPDPPARPIDPAPPPAEPRPGPTIVRAPEAHAPVVVADAAAASLQIVRGDVEPAAPESAERVDGRDVLAALPPGAGFSVDGRATLALGAGSRASVFRFEADRAYGLRMVEGSALVDTEGATQRWRMFRGGTELSFSALNGRIALECRGGEHLAVTLLEGRAELKDSGPGPRIGSGREWWCDAAGRWAERPVDVRRWKPLAALLPRQMTVFAATFEERGAKAAAFPYAVLSGRVVREGDRGYLSAAPDGETGPAPKAAIRPESAIAYHTGLRLRIRCRAGAPEVIIHLGAFRAAVPLPRRGVWVEVEAALDDFLHEGVRMVPSDVVTDVRVSLPEGQREGTLDLDSVTLYRRAR